MPMFKNHSKNKIALSLCLGIAACMVFLGTSAMKVKAITPVGSTTINSVTLNGGSSTTVLAGTLVTTTINVTVTGVNTWGSVGYTIWSLGGSTFSGGCANTPDHTSGTNTETFSITAPSNFGTYNATFMTYSNNNCNGSQTDVFTLTNGVTVLNRLITSATLDGGSSVTTLPNTPINAVVNVTLTRGGQWHGTEYRIGSGAWVCLDTTNHDSVGTHTESFSITAPASIGVYDVDFRATENSTNCGGSYSSYTLTNGITVLPPTGSLTVIKHVSNNHGGTLEADDFNMIVTPGGSFPGAEAPGNNIASLTPGLYNVSETSVDGYFASYAGDCDSSGNVTVVAGETKTCTVTNDDVAGTLTVIKNSVGGDSSFAFTLSPGSQGAIEDGFGITTVAGTGNTTLGTVNAGTYNLSETDQPGWSLTSASCDDGHNADGMTVYGVVMPLGGHITCTFTNTKWGSLTVWKDVVAPDGVTDVPDSHLFTFRLNNSPESNQLAADTSYTYENLAPGDYTISEDPDADYTLQGITSSGDTDDDPVKMPLTRVVEQPNSVVITVNPGDDAQVVFTNAQKQGTLRVVKQVLNHEIGTAVPADFTMDVTGTNVSTPSFPGSADGTVVTLDPGSYSVGESGGPIGYAASFSSECSDQSMTSNGSATCTITNSDLPTGQGAITVIKNVINDNGGTLSATDFALHVTPLVLPLIATVLPVDPTLVTSGQANFLAPDTYVVDEGTLPAGYTQTGISCSEAGVPVLGNVITLEAGHAYVCTITNDDIPTSLTLNKSVTNDNGGLAQAPDWTMSAANGTFLLQGAGPSVTDSNFGAGTFTLSEAATTDSTTTNGYTASDWVCTGGIQPDGNHITLGLGESAICTITNDDIQPKLTVTKVVVNDNSGTKGVSDFPLSVDATSVTSGEQIGINAGTYTVSEVSDVGYTASFSGDCDASGSITLGVGDEKSCTITNDDVAPAPTFPAPIANPVAGTYTSAQSVTLTVASSTSIHYTINGSIPTCETGTTFGAPIAVGSSLTIKAIACYSGGSSDVATFDYIVNIANNNGGGGGGGGGGSVLPFPSSNFGFPFITPPGQVLGASTTTVPGGEVLGESTSTPSSGNSVCTTLVQQVTDKNLVARLKGQMLLQVESCGEVWYLDPVSLERYYLPDGATAYTALRTFGLGITDANLQAIPVGDTSTYNPKSTGVTTALANRLKGRILLQVQAHGEAWFVSSVDGKRYYMKDGDAAYQIMRFLSLGITNNNLAKIPAGEMK